MRRLQITLVLLLASTFVAMGQNDNSSEGEKKAEITFEKTTHDYGKIPYKGDGSYKFEFENTGNKPLVLTDVRSSCGCTVPKWSDKPIKPGDKGTVEVKYDTRRPGKFTKYVYVLSNAKDNTVRLKITGTVTRENN
jgi:hypothetical protein